MQKYRRIKLTRVWNFQTRLLRCLCVVLLVGCSHSGDSSRVIVSGKITYDGRPVEKGFIRFLPLPGTGGNLSVGIVNNGQYHIDDFGGVPVGKHRVEIIALDPNSPPGGGGPGGPPTKQLLPAKYNDQSTLEVEIKGQQASLVQDFHLEK